MSILRPGSRRRDKRADKQKDAFKSARADEIRRQEELRKEQAQRDIFQTTEGQGISEQANISLGFDDEDEDDLFGNGTGLVI